MLTASHNPGKLGRIQTFSHQRGICQTLMQKRRTYMFLINVETQALPDTVIQGLSASNVLTQMNLDSLN